MTPFARLEFTALAAPVLIMKSFSLWCHSLLSWPRPQRDGRTYVRYVRTDTLPRLIYKEDYNMQCLTGRVRAWWKDESQVRGSRDSLREQLL